MLLEPHPGGHVISITTRTTRLHLAQILKLETLSICLPCLVLINAQSEIGYYSTLVSTQIHVHKEHPRRSIFCEQSPSLSGFKSMRMFWMFWTFHHFFQMVQLVFRMPLFLSSLHRWHISQSSSMAASQDGDQDFLTLLMHEPHRMVKTLKERIHMDT